MTLLEDLVDKYPHKPWNWNQLSMNPAISLQFILDHSKFPWNVNNVSRNISITENDIIDNKQYLWNYTALCSNPNMNYAFYKKIIIQPAEVLYIDWAALSANKSITTIDVMENPTNPWNDRFLSSNPNITSAYILNEGVSRKWHPPSVSANIGIVKRDIVNSTLSSLFEWDFRNLSLNKNLPFAYVRDNINKDWNWFSLSQNASMQDMERFHEFSWDPFALSMNSKITLSYAINHDNIKWDRKTMISNSSTTLNDVYDNIEWFCTNDQLIKKYLSSNPNISFEWVSDNIDYIDWERLSNNTLR